MPDRSIPAWAERTARQNRRFNRTMDRLTITFMLVFAGYIVLACLFGWVHSR